MSLIHVTALINKLIAKDTCNLTKVQQKSFTSNYNDSTINTQMKQVC